MIVLTSMKQVRVLSSFASSSEEMYNPLDRLWLSLSPGANLGEVV
jgi:hypothetical protein